MPDDMMPALPEPLESLTLEALATSFRFGAAIDTGGQALRVQWAEAVHWNHAAYEAERALRVELLSMARALGWVEPA